MKLTPYWDVAFLTQIVPHYYFTSSKCTLSINKLFA